MIDKRELKNLKIYILLSYLIFWILIAFTGYMISLEIPELTLTILKNFCAWTPTFVILIMFRKLYPNLRFKEYLKLNFSRKTKPRLFIVSFLLMALVSLAVVLSFFIINNKPLNTMTFISASALLSVIIIDITAGVTGEELGWRGYVLNVLQKKYVPLKAALIVGVVWGLWHLPLMIFSGFSGLELVYYMLAFMLAVISISVVITFFYNKSKNILLAMWMHFWFNFLMKIVIMDMLPLMIYLSFGYLILAIVIVLLNKKELLSKDL
jgi:membrane protease YdiL (CAAX protease family)